jgi:hypothetical protein
MTLETMTVFLTILAGVATLVLGQLFLRLLVEPIHDLKRTISDIAFALIQHANVFCNPGVTGKEREDRVANEIRQLASKLNAQMYLVPGYSRIYWIFGLPSASAITQSMKHLIGISNAVHADAKDMAVKNGEKSDRVCDLLGINLPEGDREP